MNALREAVLPPAPVRREEALRYAMQPRAYDGGPIPALEDCVRMAEGKVPCRAVWRLFPVIRKGDGLDLGFAVTGSRKLQTHLAGCDRIVLFALTAGMEMERLILRAKALSPLHGLMMNAVGAAIAEEACDRLCGRLAAAFPEDTLRDRFSPGYGDLPLSLQKDIFTALSCEKRLGLTLTGSLLMQPGKSVTAIVGLSPRKEDHREPLP